VDANEAVPLSDPVNDPVNEPVLICAEALTNPSGRLLIANQSVPAYDAETGTNVIDVAALAVVAKDDEPNTDPVNVPV
jgi:hypothetical protein